MAVSDIDINRYEREATVYYFLWFTIYVILGLSAVVLPLLAAIDVAPHWENSKTYFAALGAIAAAAYGFLKPNDYVAAFDAAVAELRSLRARADLLTPEQQADRFDVIVRLMTDSVAHTYLE